MGKVLSYSYVPRAELETKLNSLQGEADQLNKRNSEIENAVEANAILKHKIDVSLKVNSSIKIYFQTCNLIYR